MQMILNYFLQNRSVTDSARSHLCGSCKLCGRHEVQAACEAIQQVVSLLAVEVIERDGENLGTAVNRLVDALASEIIANAVKHND